MDVTQDIVDFIENHMDREDHIEVLGRINAVIEDPSFAGDHLVEISRTLKYPISVGQVKRLYQELIDPKYKLENNGKAA